MAPNKAFAIGTDPIIAIGRALLAVFGLLAIWLDPSQPARFQLLTYGLMSGYVVYAILVLILVLIRPMPSEGLAWVTHLGDLGAFSVVMYLTEGPTSPFFVFFTFALLAATLRWSWRGALWTAGAALAVLVLTGYWAWDAVGDTELEFNRFLIRSVYLAVAALLLAFLGSHEEQIRRMLAQLAASPPTLPGNGGWPIREALGFAAGVSGVRRALLAWSEDEEPWQRLALWTDGRIEQFSEAPDRYHPLIPPELEDASFLSLDATDPRSVLIHRGGGHFRRASVLPVNGELCERFQIKRVVSVPLRAEGLDARLFLLDGRGFNADDVQVAELSAVRVAALFAQHLMLQRLSTAAVTEARLRVANDIHDGVLQFLAGTGLHLKSAIAQIPADPLRAARHLADLQDALTAEQAELRTLVNRLQDGSTPVSPADGSLGPSLERLASRLEHQWGISVHWRLEPPGASLDGATKHEVRQMLAEAVANAQRHGGATSVDFDVYLEGGTVRVCVTDNGRGFPVPGRHELRELQGLGFGPRSLCKRIAARGGQLTLESGASGAHLDIRFPATLGSTASYRIGASAGDSAAPAEETCCPFDSCSRMTTPLCSMG